MPQEFIVESFISSKQLNNQSVSLVIPRIVRDKIHNVLYYKVNLNNASLRGETMLQLAKVIVRDLGTLVDRPVSSVRILGGVEFKCILMKLIEIRPTWDQLLSLLNINEKHKETFSNKYILALVLVYMRIQYYFLTDQSQSKIYGDLFKQKMEDYRKLKSVSMDTDCWSMSQTIEVEIVHIDELVDWLTTKDEIWGIPLGRCQWCALFDENNESSSEDESFSDENDDLE